MPEACPKLPIIGNGWAEDAKTTAIRLVALKYAVRCKSKAKCSKRATVGVECRDKIGHPVWRKDFCDEHAKPLITKARALGIEVFWHSDSPARVDKVTRKSSSEVFS